MLYLMHTLDENGKRIYTLKTLVDGKPSIPSHPAHFSPDDKYSRYRVEIKKRFGVHITQKPMPMY